MSKVFISFDYQDFQSFVTNENWKDQNLGTDISFSSEVGKRYLHQGEHLLKKVLSEKINSCSVVLVLVGQNTHNRPWVDYEIHHAKSAGLSVIWTQLPNPNGGPPKEIGTQPSVPFSLQAIQKAIRDCQGNYFISKFA